MRVGGKGWAFPGVTATPVTKLQPRPLVLVFYLRAEILLRELRGFVKVWCTLFSEEATKLGFLQRGSLILGFLLSKCNRGPTQH